MAKFHKFALNSKLSSLFSRLYNCGWIKIAVTILCLVLLCKALPLFFGLNFHFILQQVSQLLRNIFEEHLVLYLPDPFAFAYKLNASFHWNTCKKHSDIDSLFSTYVHIFLLTSSIILNLGQIVDPKSPVPLPTCLIKIWLTFWLHMEQIPLLILKNLPIMGLLFFVSSLV